LYERLSSARSAGSGAAAVWPRTSRRSRARIWPLFNSPWSASWCAGSQELLKSHELAGQAL